MGIIGFGFGPIGRLLGSYPETGFERIRACAALSNIAFPRSDFWTMKGTAAFSGARNGLFPDAPSSRTYRSLDGLN
jgi:hypothetical protein